MPSSREAPGSRSGCPGAGGRRGLTTETGSASGIPQQGFRLTLQETEQGYQHSSEEAAAVQAKPPAPFILLRFSCTHADHRELSQKNQILAAKLPGRSPALTLGDSTSKLAARQPPRPVESPAAGLRPQPPTSAALL